LGDPHRSFLMGRTFNDQGFTTLYLLSSGEIEATLSDMEGEDMVSSNREWTRCAYQYG